MRRVLAALALLVISACGSDNGGGTTPTPQVPNFAGQWSGQYQATACTGGGAIVCDVFLGSPATFTLTLSQNGSQASGTVALGILQVPASGPVSSSGVLNLTGTSGTSGVTIQTWASTVSGNTMSGTFRAVLNNFTPSATIDATLVNVRR